MCNHIDRLRDSAQQKGTSSKDATVVRDATRDVARDLGDISHRDELRERQRKMQGSVEGCREEYPRSPFVVLAVAKGDRREGLRATKGRDLQAGMREPISQNDGMTGNPLRNSKLLRDFNREQHQRAWRIIAIHLR